jgi:hypothetical protein
MIHGDGALLDRVQVRAMLVGAAALGLTVIGGMSSAAHFYRAYLIAWLLWVGVALGSLAILMLYHLVGGMWGFLIRRPLEAATRTLLPLAVLFLPILAGLRQLYSWTLPGAMDGEPMRHKALYLSVPFFTGRAVFYLAVWMLLAGLLNHWSAQQDRGGSGEVLAMRMQRLSAIGLVIYGLTVTFAGFDWLMSLQPEWWSSIYGMWLIVAQGLSALSLMIIVARVLAGRDRVREVATPSTFHDLGNLMLMFVMLWAYLAFSQFLIIWSGNLTEEIPWYIPRLRGGWGVVAAVLVGFHFFVPFVLLLLRRTKRSLSVLPWLAGALFLLHGLDLVWNVEPAFETHGFALHWMDLTAPIGLGGLWIALFLRQLKRMPLLPLHDPRVVKVVEAARAAQHG